MSAEPKDDIVYDLDNTEMGINWRAHFPGGAAEMVDQFLADITDGDVA